ncbi:MAG: M20/M25/M40 family metallo-hydrolase [Clostridia bacterium]|nr:M20/M25/M40 family metallo-hydrolase [Clostridia bacterium]
MINDLKTIMRIQGISSREGKIAAKLAEMIKPYTDEVSIDPLGNVIALKRGKGKKKKKIMFCAHMDEIGFIVTFIQDNGLVRVSQVGGINYVAASHNYVKFENGATGVIVPEGKVAHKDIAPDKFYIDLGVKTKKEAERKVKIGEGCALLSDCKKLYGKRYVGRPFDDRIGCYVMIEAAKKLKDVKDDVYFVFAVQEEVGCRGSRTASFTVRPDIGIAFDVTPSGDIVGADTNQTVKLGGGAAIKVKDSSVMCDQKLVSNLVTLAKENKVPYQMEVLTYGGTDTSSMQTVAGGSRAGCISIPVRFCHSQSEMIDMDDVDACVELAVLACSAEI